MNNDSKTERVQFFFSILLTCILLNISCQSHAEESCKLINIGEQWARTTKGQDVVEWNMEYYNHSNEDLMVSGVLRINYPVDDGYSLKFVDEDVKFRFRAKSGNNEELMHKFLKNVASRDWSSTARVQSMECESLN